MIGLLIYTLVALGLVVATWRRSATAFAALLSVQVVDFWGQLSSPWLVENGKFTNILAVGLIAFGALRNMMYRTRPEPKRGPIVAMTFSLWLYAALSLSWSPSLPSKLDGLKKLRRSI